jgi:hypothetical protein
MHVCFGVLTNRAERAGVGERRCLDVSLWRRFTLLVGPSLIAIACAGAGDATTASDTDGAGGSGQREVIRFAFAPDQVWDFMRDTGVLAEWEKEHNLRIHTSDAWDEFTYFAGGHGEIVSVATYELPVLEEEAGVNVVAFGQYNHQRTPMMRKAGDPYDTLADVPRGTTVCADSASATTVWSVLADQLHNVEYRVGRGRFDIALQDHFVMPELVARGDCTVAQVIPEAAAALLRKGDLEIMYDGRAPWQIYQDICACDHKGVMSNLFVATEEWYDAHPEQAAAFLELWQRGLDLWQENKEEIVSLYPQHFAVETEQDIEWMIDFMEGPNDWFADTVYMDQAWIEEETKVYNHMVQTGWMVAGTRIPRFAAVPRSS